MPAAVHRCDFQFIVKYVFETLFLENNSGQVHILLLHVPTHKTNVSHYVLRSDRDLELYYYTKRCRGDGKTKTSGKTKSQAAPDGRVCTYRLMVKILGIVNVRIKNVTHACVHHHVYYFRNVAITIVLCFPSECL